MTLQVPQANIAGMIHPQRSNISFSSPAGLVRQAVNSAGVEFSDSVKGKVLGILLPDGTRDLPLDVILPSLLPVCQNAKSILFFICTGTHNAETPENQIIVERIQAESEKAAIQPYEIIVHDCQQGPFISMGSTDRGTEILSHARLQEPDCFLVISDVKHHYFAGYSNPIKNFVPGLCAFDTTRQNHSWTMDKRCRAGVHPWHSDPALHDNPLACDQLEAMKKIVAGRPVWALVTISADATIQWADMAFAQTVTATAFDKADVWNRFTVEPVHKIIISPGGLPNDVDLYIAQRALELTKEAICDNGEILFLAACPNGVGSERTTAQFYDKLIRPLDEIDAFNQNDYRLFSHKPDRFARLIKRLNRFWFHSQIESSIIEKMHMTPCPEPQAVVDGWLDRNPNERILIVDSANKVLLRSIR